jgi:site-specific DNA-cytosine methylase
MENLVFIDLFAGAGGVTKCVWVVWEYEALPYQNSKNLYTRTNE